MPIEIDDQSIRFIGYDNAPLQFFDPNRTLQCVIQLKPDNTLDICGGSCGGGGGGVDYSNTFVRLDGNNWNLWIPAGGTQRDRKSVV